MMKSHRSNGGMPSFVDLRPKTLVPLLWRCVKLMLAFYKSMKLARTFDFERDNIPPDVDMEFFMISSEIQVAKQSLSELLNRMSHMTTLPVHVRNQPGKALVTSPGLVTALASWCHVLSHRDISRGRSNVLVPLGLARRTRRQRALERCTRPQEKELRRSRSASRRAPLAWQPCGRRGGARWPNP